MDREGGQSTDRRGGEGGKKGERGGGMARYSGAGADLQGPALPMVMVVRSSAVDRGANIQELSQYPQVRLARSDVLTIRSMLVYI
jgi:hypothetical protein